MSISEKLTAASQNVKKVYDAGKKDEYDTFWDAYQINGTRTDYSRAFLNSGWNDNNFKPKYSMTPTTCWDMFAGSKITGSLPDICTIDFSQSTNMLEMFIYSSLSRIGTVDTEKTSTIKWLFFSCRYLETIDNLILHQSSNATFAPFWEEVFCSDIKLKNITVSGTGAISGSLDMHWSPLTKQSFINVINYLCPDASDKTASFSLTAVNKAFETSAGAEDGAQSAEWNTLTGTKTNWTISLV